MKALLLNGSPRRGNTKAALEALKKGFANIDDLEITEIIANDADVSPCIACDNCKGSGSCVFDDDTNAIMEQVIEADVLVFATPVYWWGISSQMKTIIDKFYSRTSRLAECSKQVGVIVVGELPQDNLQYELITRQFICIAAYLGWDMAFCKTYTAHGPSDLRSDTAAMAEIENLWQEMK